MAAGKVRAVRWPDARITAVTAAAEADDSSFSAWVGEAVDVRLAGTDTTDPLAMLTVIVPTVASWLETCSMEDRALARPLLEQLAKAYSARSNGKAPR